MKKIKHSTELWDESQEIFSMQMGTMMHVKEAMKSNVAMKTTAVTSWIFTLLSIASFTIALTAPFDQVSVQASIFNQLEAPKVERLNEKVFFSSFDARDYSRHVTPGTQDGVVGTVYVHAMDEEITVSGLVPCIKNLVSTPKVTDLKIYNGSEQLNKAFELVIPAGTTKALTIKGNISDDTVPGNRFQAGICEAPEVVSKQGQSIEVEEIVPVYSDPASVVGHVRVKKKKGQK